jgi:hypothetical protein
VIAGRAFTPWIAPAIFAGAIEFANRGFGAFFFAHAKYFARRLSRECQSTSLACES